MQWSNNCILMNQNRRKNRYLTKMNFKRWVSITVIIEQNLPIAEKPLEERMLVLFQIHAEAQNSLFEKE
jgi:hypothetical protein